MVHELELARGKSLSLSASGGKSFSSTCGAPGPRPDLSLFGHGAPQLGAIKRLPPARTLTAHRNGSPAPRCLHRILPKLPCSSSERSEALKATGHKIRVKDNGVFWMDFEERTAGV